MVTPDQIGQGISISPVSMAGFVGYSQRVHVCETEFSWQARRLKGRKKKRFRINKVEEKGL